jgi:hypothetical protein
MMLTRDEIITILRANYAYLASEYGVKQIGLFGSYATDTPTESSDVDIVVEFGRPIGFRFVEFAEYLEHLLGKPVDVLTPVGIESIRIEGIAQRIRESTVYV